MRGLTLKRNSDDGQRTFGVLMKDNVEPVCMTLENPWINNKPDISCIPSGIYYCRRVISKRFGETFEITGVSDRGMGCPPPSEKGRILLHPGNFVKEVKACIATGSYPFRNNGELGLARSRDAFKYFMQHLDGVDEFMLTIRNDF